MLENAALIPSGWTFDEDGYFHLMLWDNLSSIYHLEDIGYCYRWGGSTAKSYNPNYMPDSIKFYDIKKEKIQKNHYLQAFPFIISYMVNAIRRHIYMLLSVKESKNKILQEIEHFFLKNVLVILSIIIRKIRRVILLSRQL